MTATRGGPHGTTVLDSGGQQPPARGHRRPDRRPGRRRHRTRWLVGLGLATLALAGAAVVAVPRFVHRGPVTVCGNDALAAGAVAGLENFAEWLQRSGSAGFVGEVGWPAGPDGAKWAALADTWYQAADAIGLPVTAWAAARWPANYGMAVYRHSSGSTAIDSSGPQARVVEEHGSTGRYLRGVVMAGGSFGAADASDTFSSKRPGRYGYDYSYEAADSYLFLARRGVKLVRLTIAWERLQPVPGQPLDPAELARVQRALGYARQAGLRVILDLHNYGQFALGTATGIRSLLLGSPDLPIAHLADFWSRLAQSTRQDPAVLGYDVMNEPVTLAAKGADGARLWEQASQAAVDAIRKTGSSAMIAVAGYGQTAPGQWGQLHPRAWITDPMNRVVYEAHAYFDADSSGHYVASYADELRRVQGTGQGATQCRQMTDLSRQSAAKFTANRPGRPAILGYPGGAA